MSGTPLNILVLCTGNSARSIIAEALFNHLGGDRVRAHSAGSCPAGQPHALALATLRAHGVPTDGLRSKSWGEFEGADAPRMDVVVTVCDSAAAEACPVWPGAPAKVHWGVPDPGGAEGDDQARRAAFEATYAVFRERIEGFLAGAPEAMSPAEAAARLKATATTL
ncbi:MAG TPA: arsenate reductase ArsC [Azospirillum sp.]